MVAGTLNKAFSTPSQPVEEGGGGEETRRLVPEMHWANQWWASSISCMRRGGGRCEDRCEGREWHRHSLEWRRGT